MPINGRVNIVCLLPKQWTRVRFAVGFDLRLGQTKDKAAKIDIHTFPT